MLTGESLPVEKCIGSAVSAASINKFGSFKFRVEKAGENTSFADILRFVAEAQSSKAPIQRSADKAAGYFIPFIILAATATFLIWYFIIFHCSRIDLPVIYAVSVLTASCPCALGLATPAAIITSIGIGAKHGILIKNGSVLEKISSIDSVVFDKTGTITEGSLELTDIVLVCHGKHKFSEDAL